MPNIAVIGLDLGGTKLAGALFTRTGKLHIHPSHNVPGDTTAKQRLDEALAEYKRRIAGV